MDNFELVFYSSGNSKPIDKFLSSSTAGTRAKIFQKLKLLKTYGPMAGMPHVKKINHQLFELRIRGHEEVRLLFSCYGRTLYFAHIFKKKTRKIPVKEISIAQKRLAYWQ
jgi:phage-related protein